VNAATGATGGILTVKVPGVNVGNMFDPASSLSWLIVTVTGVDPPASPLIRTVARRIFVELDFTSSLRSAALIQAEFAGKVPFAFCPAHDGNVTLNSSATAGSESETVRLYPENPVGASSRTKSIVAVSPIVVTVAVPVLKVAAVAGRARAKSTKIISVAKIFPVMFIAPGTIAPGR
jgi:hypothetical protein